MLILAELSIKRLTAMFCIALALMFSGSLLSNAVDSIQHAPGGSPVHEHLLLSDISLEHADHMDHHDPEPDGQDQSDPLASGHHHHGDSGSGVIVLASADDAMTLSQNDRHDLVPDRPAIGIKIQGPERPPKASLISV